MANQPLLDARSIDFQMELPSQGVLLQLERLVRTQRRAGQRGHARRQLELVAMPVQHGLGAEGPPGVRPGPPA